MSRPWSDVVPPEDIASFAREFTGEDRPIQAGTRPAVLVVDMTRAFVDSAYPTGYSATGYPAVAATAALLSAARSRSLPIFYTKLYADPDYVPHPAERGLWRSTEKPLPPGLPPGDVIVAPLAPRPEDIVINKADKPSAFFGTPLTSYLQYLGRDTVIITGMTTSGCVRASVLDSFQHNFHTLVPHECCADRSQISHKVSLFDMHMKYADVVSLQETLDYLERLD